MRGIFFFCANFSLMPSCKASGNKHNPSFIMKPLKERETRRETTTNRSGLFKTQMVPWRPMLSNCHVPPFLLVATVTTGNRYKSKTTLEKMREIIESRSEQERTRDNTGRESERNSLKRRQKSAHFTNLKEKTKQHNGSNCSQYQGAFWQCCNGP